MPHQRPWDRAIADDRDRLQRLHLYRQRRTVTPLDAVHVELNGRRLTNFSSNNYLGLTHHPKIRAAVEQTVAREGFGCGAAPLITGYGPAHESAERAIAHWKGTETAVLLPSGYQANLAAIQAIVAIGKLIVGKSGGAVRFLVDKLSHASLIDAIRGSGEEFRVFPHNHIPKLTRLLNESPQGTLQVVVTESIFSMDGDAADLAAIAQLKERHGFLLMLDEAHATGIYGPAGAGLAAELGLTSAVDVSVLTLSKAMGGMGGAVCGSTQYRDMLVNHSRAYLFSTGVPAVIAAAAEAAIDVIRTEPQRMVRVRQLARRVREAVGRMGFHVPAGDSPIVPIILGAEESALWAAEHLMLRGLLVAPIRPPTVARGSSRLRITLSSEQTDQEVDDLLAALSELQATGGRSKAEG